MTTFLHLKGLVALVTGAASGLGRATAEHLLKKEVRVVIADLPSSKGTEVARDLGDNCIFVPTNVISEADVTNALSVTEEKFKHLDILVNCAGLSRANAIYNANNEKPFIMDHFELIMKTNVVGTFNTMRLSARLMGLNSPAPGSGQRGVIINTTSSAAFDGCSGQSAFSATQGAIAAMTLPVARDLASQGIRCISLAPGYFNTILVQSMNERVIQMFCDATPSPHRLGNPEEFALLVQKVIENPMINGTTIRIDGGIRLTF